MRTKQYTNSTHKMIKLNLFFFFYKHISAVTLTHSFIHPPIHCKTNNLFSFFNIRPNYNETLQTNPFNRGGESIKSEET